MDQRFLPLLRTQRSSGTRTFPGKSLMAVWALGIPLLVSGCGGDSGGSGGTVPPPVPPSVAAQTIYSFGGSNTDAMSGSESGVLSKGSDGNFYGTTYRGGLALPICRDGAATSDPADVGCGAAYEITPAGEETVLHLFTGAPGDGLYPEVLIKGNDGNLYGTTQQGGANNLGTVFRITPDGVDSILYSFKGADGAGGLGLLQAGDGNLYGTTQGGGANNSGTVFKLTMDGVETVLYSFTGAQYGGAGNDGSGPGGQLIQGTDGNFYGTTLQGGLTCGSLPMDPAGCGVVFAVTPSGIETVLHWFSGPDGYAPNGLIQGNDGNFYGTCGGGPGAAGVAFRISPQGQETTLYAWDDTVAGGGYGPGGLVQASDGNFYGKTGTGGVNEGGTFFQMTPLGLVTTLYSFPNTSVPGDTGAEPDTNLVQGDDGGFYGATAQNGTYNRGYFFKLTLH
jgi:uncharacterized repeat protein (TIGR03803 family)